MRQLLKAFKSLSDETRLRILNLLLERECCVCEVMQSLQISQTRASRNINTLYDAGFLKLKREGLWAVYSIDRDNLKKCYIDIIDIIREVLRDDETTMKDIERLRNAERVGPRCVASIRQLDI